MSDKVLVLRVCHEGGWSDGQSGRPRFQWPLTEGAAAEAGDWNPEPVCGYGLHGWLWGAGDVGSAGAEWAFTEAAPVWMVLEVERDLVVPLEGGVKVKFPRCVVRKFGSLQECAAEISSQAPAGTAVIGHTATAGYAGTATAGDAGTATAGYAGTATAGDAGLIEIRWWDEKACGGRGRHRVAIGYVGEGGIEAGEYYKVKVENGQAQLVLADPQPVVKK
jgi:hypothetical protein